MQIKALKTRVFKEQEDLLAFILKYLERLPEKLPENSVLVVTSKIVALAEGRTAVFKSKRQKIKIIREESEFAIKTKHAWLTIKDGMVMAGAGIDESNAEGGLILLPKDSFESAQVLRKKLIQKFKLKNLGILITDSRTGPLRAGIVGMSLGYAGFKGIRDYRGTRDIFGRILKMSRTDVADSLATAAVLCMGEGREQQPLAIITEAPIEFTKKVNKKELLINPEDDLYLPLFKSILKK